ncbi:amidohydrolase family protein [Paraglaciecola marina]|uniref:amidohydrolase family protein n=1 Tax=Paraglaciecola marina TaxID=2500157 RepID=UPI001EF143FC|nr:amidohydrolase family protein [Paraglaciecola marina]
MNKAPLKIIDPHIHLFDLNKGKYDWLKPYNAPLWPDKTNINRDFNETNLHLGEAQELAGFVHIEAGFDNQQPWREIDWLEQNCTLPFKSVAYADLCTETFNTHIQQLKQRASVVGIRYILDDDAYKVLSSNMTYKHLALLQQQNLSFDAQLSLADDSGVGQLITIVKKLPLLKVIINHGGWPLDNFTPTAQRSWNANLIKLSQYDNVAIKLSGWEMSDRRWKLEQASNLLKDCLAVFGEQRVMLASNFPLCTFSHSYKELWGNYKLLLEGCELCPTNIIYNNALHWYQFD